jgi:hypothetical protein
MKRRTTRSRARGAGLTAAAAALAAVLGAALARLTNRGRSEAGVGSAEISASARYRRRRAGSQPDEVASYTCDCGADYRVSGTDRHRVYWLADASEDSPVMGDRCVQCDAPLPSGRAAPAA